MSERDICKKCGQMFTYHGGGQCPGAREFWINSHPERGHDIVSRENIGGTHVIEYSAYAAEKEARQLADYELDKIRVRFQMEQELRHAVEKELTQLKEKLELAGKSLEEILYQVRVENTEIVNKLQEKLAVAIEQFNNLNKVWNKLGPDKDDDFGHMNEAMKKMNKALKKLEEK